MNCKGVGSVTSASERALVAVSNALSISVELRISKRLKLDTKALAAFCVSFTRGLCQEKRIPEHDTLETLGRNLSESSSRLALKSRQARLDRSHSCPGPREGWRPAHSRRALTFRHYNGDRVACVSSRRGYWAAPAATMRSTSGRPSSIARGRADQAAFCERHSTVMCCLRHIHVLGALEERLAARAVGGTSDGDRYPILYIFAGCCRERRNATLRPPTGQ